MTGESWDRGGHSYELEKKRHRRMLREYKVAERSREKTRDRSGRQRPADDGAQVLWCVLSQTHAH